MKGEYQLAQVDQSLDFKELRWQRLQRINGMATKIECVMIIGG